MASLYCRSKATHSKAVSARLRVHKNPMCPFSTAAGVFYIMWSAGIVSAAPVQLMSDHVFLGSSLAAVVGAEAVLLRLQISRRGAVPRRHPAEHPLMWAGARLLRCLPNKGPLAVPHYGAAPALAEIWWTLRAACSLVWFVGVCLLVRYCTCQ